MKETMTHYHQAETVHKVGGLEFLIQQLTKLVHDNRPADVSCSSSTAQYIIIVVVVVVVIVNTDI